MPPIRFAVESAALATDMPATRKLVLLALAALADNNTGIVPEHRKKSLTELARLTSLGRATVARDLDLLEFSGWVVRARPTPQDARHGMKTGYRLTLPPGVVQDMDQVVHGIDQGSPRGGRKRDPSDPSKDPSKTSGQHPAPRRGPPGSSRADTAAFSDEEKLAAVGRALQVTYNPSEYEDLTDDDMLDIWERFIGKRRTSKPVYDPVDFLCGIFGSFEYVEGILSNTPDRDSA